MEIPTPSWPEIRQHRNEQMDREHVGRLTRFVVNRQIDFLQVGEIGYDVGNFLTGIAQHADSALAGLGAAELASFATPEVGLWVVAGLGAVATAEFLKKVPDLRVGASLVSSAVGAVGINILARDIGYVDFGVAVETAAIFGASNVSRLARRFIFDAGGNSNR